MIIIYALEGGCLVKRQVSGRVKFHENIKDGFIAGLLKLNVFC